MYVRYYKNFFLVKIKRIKVKKIKIIREGVIVFLMIMWDLVIRIVVCVL